MALAMARLGELNFQSPKLNSTIMRMLPTRLGVQKQYRNKNIFDRECQLCSTYYAHKCQAWTNIISEIQNLTHNALKQERFLIDSDELLIQYRCDIETVLSHPEYGPIHFSFYDSIPNNTETISVLSETMTDPLCRAIFHKLISYLKKNGP